MFRLIKLGITLVGLAAFAWFGVTVKLGSMTLFQHLRAIGQTKESQELVDGTRQAAGPLVDDVRRKFQDGTKDGKNGAKVAGKEQAQEGRPLRRPRPTRSARGARLAPPTARRSTDSFAASIDEHGDPERVPKPSREGLRAAEPRFVHAIKRRSTADRVDR